MINHNGDDFITDEIAEYRESLNRHRDRNNSRSITQITTEND